MTTFQAILLCIVLSIWLCFSILSLISAIQSFIFDRKHLIYMHYIGIVR